MPIIYRLLRNFHPLAACAARRTTKNARTVSNCTSVYKIARVNQILINHIIFQLLIYLEDHIASLITYTLFLKTHS